MSVGGVDGEPALRSFGGLRRDATAGLTFAAEFRRRRRPRQPHKMLKRQMYGRVSLGLLRKRVIHAV